MGKAEPGAQGREIPRNLRINLSLFSHPRNPSRGGATRLGQGRRPFIPHSPPVRFLAGQLGLLEPSAPPPPPPPSLQHSHTRASHRGCTSRVFDQCGLTSPTCAGTNQFLSPRAIFSFGFPAHPPPHPPPPATDVFSEAVGVLERDESLGDERSQGEGKRGVGLGGGRGETDGRTDGGSLPLTLKVMGARTQGGSCTIVLTTLAFN